jgi:hypothetical protein
MPSGSTIVDSDQNGSRRAETVGIGAHFFGEVVISLGSRLSAPGFLHGHAFKIVHQVPRADITRVITGAKGVAQLVPETECCW